MNAFGWRRLRPVTKAAVFWAGVGSVLVLYGLYDLLTDSCSPRGDAGCGEPFGFVLVLWGVPILLVSAVVLGSRFVAETSREGTSD